ncbi:Putative nucleoside-diphosphate-sugar epimerase [Sinomonas atrocyanea]|uniref:Putative nucleoside-diphosphate-sugar epimerase n=1 Tax=Sinomonas atrocyanea TaxID=37927 RepID=A0A127A3S3_9MICC|nr:SDR family oxidoreductase [Sinomonas atrocyanea]AMM34100.1 Putative nucleoside-diphosphate-sugar epimerase [Sinomonas atrocyanea]GEB65134.1 NAD(P)-dependent oxidoreductase [Sinomonas atrocyanea]GGG58777.1 NAD(P)-dependent oxidoreductase [Sinomonas atrocyanea]
MDGSPTLGITGVTGAIGGHVARLLSERGEPLVLLPRDPAKAPELPRAVVRPADYADGNLCERSLEGVETLLMVSGRESERRLDEHRSFIDAAAAAGVRHLVYTSFMGAAPDATFTLARDHFATEEHIKAAGLAYTFLRDCLYADFLEAMVGDDGVLRGPAGNGAAAVVAQADVARCAAAVLLDPAAHAGVTYTLTGPEALTMAQIAHVISAVRGRPVTFHNETVAEAYESRRKWPAPDWQYEAWVSTYTAIAAGEMEHVSDDVETITGRRPMSLKEVLLAR